MKKSFRQLVLAAIVAFYHVSTFAASSQLVAKTVVSWNDTVRMQFQFDQVFFQQGWDTLPQVRFWKEVINLTSDTCIINVASCRKPVHRVSRTAWLDQTESEKTCYKDSLCSAHCLEQGTNLFVTAGKGEFYEVKKTLSLISEAVDAFERNGCDPWYAQTILLIESPGKLKTKSSVGASGPFQLMPSVARRYGLRVTKYVDERSDVRKAAKAASRLINTACIPHIKAYLDARNITYQTTDLWFRLLVLHAYHAGAGNVHCVIDAINPQSGGVPLIQQVWQTTCGGFKNESQNYSQIALASILNFDQLINLDGDTVYLVRGDKLMHEFRQFKSAMRPLEAHEYLQQTMSTYEKDFMDDMIPYDQFMSRIAVVRSEYARLAASIGFNDGDIQLKEYPASEAHITFLANELSKRRRYEDAIRLLQLNLDLHPQSAAVVDTLVRTYRLTGDNKKADQLARKQSGE
ncbi:MAG: transglycosylase SLT domain-containing protein [Bacteroidota bacterium]